MPMARPLMLPLLPHLSVEVIACPLHAQVIVLMTAHLQHSSACLLTKQHVGYVFLRGSVS